MQCKICYQNMTKITYSFAITSISLFLCFTINLANFFSLLTFGKRKKENSGWEKGKISAVKIALLHASSIISHTLLLNICLGHYNLSILTCPNLKL